MKQLNIFQKTPEPDYEKLRELCQTTGVAFQKLIRDTKVTIEKSCKADIKTAMVAEVTYQQAKKIILDYEWLGTMPSQVCAAFGIFFGDELGGVVCFSDVRQQTKMSFLNHPAVILARGACVHWAHPHSASFLISRACKMIDNEKYDFVVAYSDPEAGEIGTVYQACNWFCVGTSQKMRWTAPDGSTRSAYHHRNLACSKSPKVNGKRTTDKVLAEEIKNDLLSKGWKWELGPKRYRYAFPLGSGQRLRKSKKMLKEISIPYPKRNRRLNKKQLVVRAKNIC